MREVNTELSGFDYKLHFSPKSATYTPEKPKCVGFFLCIFFYPVIYTPENMVYPLLVFTPAHLTLFMVFSVRKSFFLAWLPQKLS